MLFYIDHTIASYAEKQEFTMDQLILLSNLATAHWQGKCIVTGHIESIKYLMANLGAPASGIYAMIHDDHSMYGTHLKVIPRIFVLTNDIDASQELLPDYIKRDCVFLNLSNAAKWNLSNGCSLIGENLDDCKFYTLLGKIFSVSQKIDGIRLCFSCEPGGGNSTHRLYKECIIEKKVPTLCIVDSDQKYGKFGPCQNTPKRGETAQFVENTDKELSQLSQVVPHECLTLQVHEAENLIPTKVLYALMMLKLPAIELGLKTLERLKEILDGEPILYYDFKNGIRYPSNQDSCKYWTEIAKALNEDFLPIPEDKLSSAQKSGKEKPPASPPFFPISNNHLLENAQKWMEENAVEPDEYLKVHWDQIGRAILTWGCAVQPLRS